MDRNTVIEPAAHPIFKENLKKYICPSLENLSHRPYWAWIYI
jgi:hypothetical protein